MRTVPRSGESQDCLYKTVGGRALWLTFLAPHKRLFARSPVYYLISGGGWASMSRSSMLECSAASVEALRDRGFAAASIDYRVCTEEGVVLQDILTDCFDGARYLAHYAKILGIDKDCFVVSGHSAGGHLALMTAYAPQEMFAAGQSFADTFTVAAAAPMSPVTILWEEAGQPQRVGFDCGGAVGEGDSLEERKRLSPVTYVGERTPPTLLMAGSADTLVYPVSSALLHDRLKEYGVRSELLISEGGGHCFERVRAGAAPSLGMEDMQGAIVRFALEQAKERSKQR